MADSAPDNPYLRDAVLTAPPEQLQLMLYDGAIRFASQARDAIVRKDYETTYERLTRAQHIVLEMHSGLDHDVDAKLCARMASLYMFIYHKLIDANIHHDAGAVDDALKILRMERETWRMVVDQLTGERAGMAEADGPTSDAPATSGTFAAEA